MIRIYRPNEVPETLTSENIILSLELVEEARHDNEKFDWQGHNHWKTVREILWTMQHQKCAFCERSREMKYETDVEHFRPKSKVSDEPDHPGYWWLAYDWDNLLAACKSCNSGHKGTKFPLSDSGKRATKQDDSLETENAMLIDPSKEDPEVFFAYDARSITRENGDAYSIVKILGTDDEDRGRMTIDVLGLKEGELPIERGRVYDDVRYATRNLEAALRLDSSHAVKQATSHLCQLTAAERPYAGTARYYARIFGYGEFL